MSFHCLAYTDSIGNVTNDDIPGISDPVFTLANGHYLPQEDLRMFFAAALGPNMDRIRLVSPTNQQITLPFIRPFNLAALPATDPNIADYRGNPFAIEALEELAIEATTNAVGPSRITAVIGVGRGLVPPPIGTPFTMRFTSVTAAVANAWTQVVATPANLLPNATYACIGNQAFSTNQIASRVNFENQVYRPGGIGVGALGNRTHPMWEKGGLGTWGRFVSTRLPIFEVLANAADAVHEFYADFIKVG